MNSKRSAIVLVVDQLGASFLSPYGNTWFQTENLCRIAARSETYDFAISDTPDLAGGVDSLWYGTHAAAGFKNNGTQQKGTHIAAAVAGGGGGSTLITDEPRIAALPGAAEFDRSVKLDSRICLAPADDPTSTLMSDFFARVIPELGRVDPGDLLWLHSRGLAGPWDAPMELRRQWVDEEDPDPPAFVDSPSQAFDEASDSPDLLLGYQQTCAAQVFILDQFLGVLFDEINSLPNLESTLLVITSTRSTANGEHGHIGTPVDLHNESLHVPMIVCPPADRLAVQPSSRRCGPLVQPQHLNAALRDWFSGALRDVMAPDVMARDVMARDVMTGNGIAVAATADSLAVQTPFWKMIRLADGACKLYVKPDDRWEVNNVFSRCRQIVGPLNKLLDDCLLRIASGESLKGMEIQEELMVRH